MQAPRNLRASAPALLVLAMLTQAGCFLPSAYAPAYYLAAPLAPTAGGAGGGRVETFLTPLKRTFFVALEGLAPGEEYTVMIGTEMLTALATDANGSSSVSMDLPGPHLDPRGRSIRVLDAGGGVVLSLVAPNHPAYHEAEVAPLSSFGSGGGFVQTTTIAGVSWLSVNVQGAEPGTYDVLANGEAVATLDAPDGSGTATLAPPPFDPRDTAFELLLGGVGYFAGGGRAGIEGLDFCTSTSVEQELFAAIAGSGRARLVTRENCSRRFEVEVEMVPMGSYDVVVGGVVRGALAVGSDENAMTFGSITFAPGESASLPLDFEPLGAQVDVRVADDLWFTADPFEP
jgi:hypothetical protein